MAHRANPPVLHVDLYFSIGNRPLSEVPCLARGLKRNLAVLHSLAISDYDSDGDSDEDEGEDKCQRFFCAVRVVVDA